MKIEREESHEVLVGGAGDADVLFTCEHASQRIVEPWRLPDEDGWLKDTHWAYDLGAADLTTDLVVAMGAVGILSRFSRLLVDPNRPTDAPDLFRGRAEGREVALNRNVTADDRERRLSRLYQPFHDAVRRELHARPARIVFAVHSFTPLYEGQPRTVELGVLFDDEEELALSLQAAFAREGFDTQLNEPYSGKGGLLYSAHRHACATGRRAVEIEVRQDLAVQASVRERIVGVVARELGRAT